MTNNLSPSQHVFENHHIKVEIVDGIMHAYYKPGLKLTLEDAKLIVHEKLKLCNGQDYPFVIHDGGVVSMDREARVYFSSDEGTKGISVAAFIEASVFSKMLINFFLKITKPKVKSKAFGNVDEALVWIRQQLNNQ